MSRSYTSSRLRCSIAKKQKRPSCSSRHSAANAGVRRGHDAEPGAGALFEIDRQSARPALRRKSPAKFYSITQPHWRRRSKRPRPGVCTVHFTSPKNCRENIDRVVRQLAQLQLTAQAGLAATPDLSFLAACLAQPVLQIDDPQNFLAPLPIEILRYLPNCVALCERRTISLGHRGALLFIPCVQVSQGAHKYDASISK